jgi:hypothetical protein
MWEKIKEEITSFERKRGEQKISFEDEYRAMRDTKRYYVMGLFYAFSQYRLGIDKYRQAPRSSWSLRSFVEYLERGQDPHLKYLSNLIQLVQIEKRNADVASCPAMYKEFLDVDKILNVFREMLKKNYRVPQNEADVHLHLWVLLSYYFLPFNVTPLISELKIDTVLSSLSFSVGRYIYSADLQAKDLARVRKSAKSKNIEKIRKKRQVLKYYNKIKPFAGGCYSIANIIIREMQQANRRPPSQRTIVRYLKEDNLC